MLRLLLPLLMLPEPHNSKQQAATTVQQLRYLLWQ
jgi:hypothetical protein